MSRSAYVLLGLAALITIDRLAAAWLGPQAEGAQRQSCSLNEAIENYYPLYTTLSKEEQKRYLPHLAFIAAPKARSLINNHFLGFTESLPVLPCYLEIKEIALPIRITEPGIFWPSYTDAKAFWIGLNSSLSKP